MAIMRNGAQDDANEIKFNNSETPELSSSNVQDAIIELNNLIEYNQVNGKLGWKKQSLPIGSISGVPKGAYEEPMWADIGNGAFALHFGDSKSHEAYGYFSVDSDYKPGSLVFPQIHWAPDSISTGNVRWIIEYSISKGHGQNEIISVPLAQVIIPGTANGIEGELLTTEINPLNAFTFPEPSSIVLVRIYREGTSPLDTFIGNAIGLIIDFYYESNLNIAPNRKPNFYS